MLLKGLILWLERSVLSTDNSKVISKSDCIAFLDAVPFLVVHDNWSNIRNRFDKVKCYFIFLFINNNTEINKSIAVKMYCYNNQWYGIINLSLSKALVQPTTTNTSNRSNGGVCEENKGPLGENGWGLV